MCYRTAADQSNMSVLYHCFISISWTGKGPAALHSVSQVILLYRSHLAWNQVQSKHYTTDEGGQPPSQISLVETSGEKKADASCCYLRMRDSIGWNDTLDDGLREDIGFSSGAQFLEGMTDVHLRSRPPKHFSSSVAMQLPHSGRGLRDSHS